MTFKKNEIKPITLRSVIVNNPEAKIRIEIRKAQLEAERTIRGDTTKTNNKLLFRGI